MNDAGWQNQVYQHFETPDIRINTAGAYVRVQGRYPFAIGVIPHNGKIPVVRLGGHREAAESGWACARREVFEEACLDIHPLRPRCIYVADGDCIDGPLQEVPWDSGSTGDVPPVLVVAYRRAGAIALSLMFLAQADRLPRPSSEVQGLLMLNAEWIHRLCRETLTFEEYLAGGGQAILTGTFDGRMVLEPFAQLRLLSRILKQSPDLAAG